MNRTIALTLAFLLGTVLAGFAGAEGASAQDVAGQSEVPDYSEAYRVYIEDGTPVSFSELMDAVMAAEAVLIGETHTDPVGHWLEHTILRTALERNGYLGGTADPGPVVALSLEMFERDVQGILLEYLNDYITEAQFLASARPWPWYEQDYRPLVETAKEAGVPVIAANAPRRYVNRISRLGRDALDDLPPEPRRSVAPLPFPGPSDAYRAEWNALMSNMSMDDQCPVREPEVPEGHVPVGGAAAAGTADAAPPVAHTPPPTSHGGSFMENGLQAQTLWDATMAHSITRFLDDASEAIAIHMVGAFHVANHTGIPEKIEYYRPGTRTLVVHIATADDIAAFDPTEHAGRGDFVILTDKALDLNWVRNCGG